MAIQLSLTDGTTTVYLNNYVQSEVMEYTPKSPAVRRRTFTGIEQDGGEQVEATQDNVTEKAECRLLGGNTAWRATISSLNRLFRLAERRQKRRLGARVYVQLKTELGDTLYRSEILSGRVELGNESLDVNYLVGMAEVAVLWERRFYWEGPEVELALANTATAAATGGVTVFNHYDGATHQNWVQIAAADVAGDLPAPIRLEMQNTYNDSDRGYQVYVAHNILSDPANFNSILEAEDGASGTPVVYAAASGGNYVSMVVNSASEVTLQTWTLSAALLAQAGGNYFRLIARIIQDLPADDVWLKFKVKLAGLTPIAETDWTLVPRFMTVMELGTIQLPPYLIEVGGQGALTLALVGKRTGGVNRTMLLDYIQLSPLDGWRRYAPRGYGFAYLTTLIDDGMSGNLWTNWPGSGNIGHYVGYGEILKLQPGALQRLYFLVRTIVGNSPIDLTLSVRAYYRPRRLEL